LNQPPARGRGRRTQGPLATIGQSAVTGKPIEVRTGKFGPYVTDGQVNATIPSSKDPQKLTLDDALELISAREDRMRQQGKDPRPQNAVRAPTRRAAKAVKAKDAQAKPAKATTTSPKAAKPAAKKDASSTKTAKKPAKSTKTRAKK
jgi:DNA topoisomerase-1